MAVAGAEIPAADVNAESAGCAADDAPGGRPARGLDVAAGAFAAALERGRRDRDRHRLSGYITA
jgi:hypothetical protein